MLFSLELIAIKAIRCKLGDDEGLLSWLSSMAAWFNF
jgi:hypothetical protein